jgi:hypothetical protein
MPKFVRFRILKNSERNCSGSILDKQATRRVIHSTLARLEKILATPLDSQPGK